MMNTEIEVKFCRVDVEDIRARLKSAGATCVQPMRLMRRVNMEAEHHSSIHAFLRVRDEGDRVTLTYKQRSNYEGSEIDGIREVEVEVSDFEKTIEIFRLSGLPPMTYQETRRETWTLDDTEIVIDEWPWIDPMIEIEGPTEDSLKDTAKQLGLDWTDAMICQIDKAYELQYDFAEGVRGIIQIGEIKFDTPLPKQLIPKA